MKKIIIKDIFDKDWVSREAGEKLRNIILDNAQDDKKNEKMEIDFKDMIIASTSFFDEAFAKLCENNWKLEDLEKKICFININPRDKKLLFDLFKRRLK